MEIIDGNFDLLVNRILFYDFVYYDIYFNNKVNVNFILGIVIVVLVGLCFILEFVFVIICKCYWDDVMEVLIIV